MLEFLTLDASLELGGVMYRSSDLRDRESAAERAASGKNNDGFAAGMTQQVSGKEILDSNLSCHSGESCHTVHVHLDSLKNSRFDLMTRMIRSRMSYIAM